MNYLRFEVRLIGAERAPWRRFLIKKAATFDSLHLAIQDACGWENCHLFAFRRSNRGGTIAGIPDDFEARPTPDARGVKLAEHFKGAKPASCIYEYDFGDGWLHEVRLVETVLLPERFVRRLEAGERAFPPEDCGGIPGYENCVAVALDRPTDEVDDPEELREWLGDWHPERFDLAAAKRRFDL